MAGRIAVKLMCRMGNTTNSDVWMMQERYIKVCTTVPVYIQPCTLCPKRCGYMFPVYPMAALPMP